MASARVDHKATSELLQVAQALKLRRVYDPDKSRMQLQRAMDRVLEYLGDDENVSNKRDRAIQQKYKWMWVRARKMFGLIILPLIYCLRDC